MKKLSAGSWWRGSSGFTLAELLLVIAIIIILLGFMLLSMTKQTEKAKDARRKSDLTKLIVAFEEYQNDKGGVIPPEGIISECGGTSLRPYLQEIPCDPQQTPYGYFPSAATGGYRVCAILQTKSDPAIEESGCGGIDGCGVGGGFNYCLSSGTPQSAVGTSDQAPPTDPFAGEFACNSSGTCKSYTDPQCKGCKRSYADPYCSGACSDSANWCTDEVIHGTPECP